MRLGNRTARSRGCRDGAPSTSTRLLPAPPQIVLSLDMRLFSKLLKFLILHNIVNSTKAPSGEVAKVPFLRCSARGR